MSLEGWSLAEDDENLQIKDSKGAEISNSATTEPRCKDTVDGSLKARKGLQDKRAPYKRGEKGGQLTGNQVPYRVSKHNGAEPCRTANVGGTGSFARPASSLSCKGVESGVGDQPVSIHACAMPATCEQLHIRKKAPVQSHWLLQTKSEYLDSHFSPFRPSLACAAKQQPPRYVEPLGRSPARAAVTASSRKETPRTTVAATVSATAAGTVMVAFAATNEAPAARAKVASAEGTLRSLGRSSEKEVKLLTDLPRELLQGRLRALSATHAHGPHRRFGCKQPCDLDMPVEGETRPLGHSVSAVLLPRLAYANYVSSGSPMARTWASKSLPALRPGRGEAGQQVALKSGGSPTRQRDKPFLQPLCAAVTAPGASTREECCFCELSGTSRSAVHARHAYLSAALEREGNTLGQGCEAKSVANRSPPSSSPGAAAEFFV
mmetsp:Transcript_35401/g.68084  ORF Transcript_35401/g.68084 Transcript_35401/m.68084 type:complete len:435 (-) Transcript_35401:818-2122(-)